MSFNDLEDGRRGIGPPRPTSADWQAGESQRQAAASQQKLFDAMDSLNAQNVAAANASLNIGTGQARGGVAAPRAPTTLGDAASVAATVFAVLYFAYGLFHLQLAWVPLLLGVALAAGIGAAAGAVLYVALVVLRVLLKVALGLAAIGICLHLLGLIDFWQVLRQIGRAAGL